MPFCLFSPSFAFDHAQNKVPTDFCPGNLPIETFMPRLCKVVDLPTEVVHAFLLTSWKFAAGLPNHSPPTNFA